VSIPRTKRRVTVVAVAALFGLGVVGVIGDANAQETPGRTSPPAAGSSVRTPLAPNARAASTARYFYAQGRVPRVERPATGARTRVTVHQPALRGDSHSLAELLVGLPNLENAIEFGWTVDPSLFGDARPRLFVFRWVDNDGRPECYNACGFVPYHDSSNDTVEVPLGTALTVGSTVQLSIDHQAGRWWTSVNGVRMGYFPDSVWTDAGIEFTTPDVMQVFGEVAAGTSKPCARMGDGTLATETAGALFSSVTFLPTGLRPVDLATFSTSASYYRTFKVSGTQVRFGGPGAYAGTPPVGSGCTATVPFLRESSRSVAANRVTQAGLVPQFTGSTAADAWVESQSPAPGTQCPVGSTVTIRLEDGPIP
jgi:hypothetical protein